MRARRGFGILAAAGLSSATAWGADSYTIDPVHTIPVFEFKHLGMTTQSGRFDRAKGKVVLDRDAHKGSVWFEVDSASLDMGAGTEKSNSPGYRLLDASRFPTITFRSDQLYFNSRDDVVAARGELTLLGVAKPVTVWVKRFRCAVNPLNRKMTCAADITATVRRSEFGMVGLIPAVSDEIGIEIPVEAYKD